MRKRAIAMLMIAPVVPWRRPAEVERLRACRTSIAAASRQQAANAGFGVLRVAERGRERQHAEQDGHDGEGRYRGFAADTGGRRRQRQ